MLSRAKALVAVLFCGNLNLKKKARVMGPMGGLNLGF